MFMLISRALISTQAALLLLIQNISPFLIGLNPATNSSSGAYHNYLKDVTKIQSIRFDGILPQCTIKPRFQAAARQHSCFGLTKLLENGG